MATVSDLVESQAPVYGSPLRTSAATRKSTGLAGFLTHVTTYLQPSKSPRRPGWPGGLVLTPDLGKWTPGGRWGSRKVSADASETDGLLTDLSRVTLQVAEAGPRPGYLESNSVLNRLVIPKLICTFKSIQNLKISRAQATPQTSEVTKSGVRRRLHQTQCLRLPGLSTSRTPAPCGPRDGCGHQKRIVSDLGQARRVSLYLSAPAQPPTFHSLEPPEGSSDLSDQPSCSSDSKPDILSGIAQRAGVECRNLTARFSLSAAPRAGGSGLHTIFGRGWTGDGTSARNEEGESFFCKRENRDPRPDTARHVEGRGRASKLLLSPLKTIHV
ncbi:uncharacterized protein LOC120599320 [Pteropus medius]|uniref:uncharacterized protein LOC120599320 n=1 Tax=Pteropus vampyrus TaxID=132908 RepID=UPI00196ABDA8|nr:uncharacterized protein LOC120599320 [Pteropus giganteus]